jgi:hypothetical protein
MKLLWVMLIGTVFFVPTGLLNAATLYIDPGIATLYRGDAITASIRIMPDEASGECINTADVVVSYPDSIQPVDVSVGRSIFSVWVESPVINKEERTVTFAGGVPNGYCGRVDGDPSLTNVIADIVFRSPGLQIGAASDSNVAVIEFSPETSVYLNDGQGTKADVRLLSSTITLEKTAGAGGIIDDWRTAVRDDNVPPEGFSIALERDPVAFNGRYFIVFTTSDKQTGLSHYEVMEEPLSEVGAFTWGRADAPWVRAVSPYVLEDQSLNSTIRVRAFDKAGNEYVATFLPDESLRTLSKSALTNYLAIGLIALLVILTAAVALWWWQRRRRSQKTEVEVVDLQEEIV